jgi:hypothetical protein
MFFGRDAACRVSGEKRTVPQPFCLTGAECNRYRPRCLRPGEFRKSSPTYEPIASENRGTRGEQINVDDLPDENLPERNRRLEWRNVDFPGLGGVLAFARAC